MRFTKRILTMATCAVMAASSMVRMSASAAKYDCSNGDIYIIDPAARNYTKLSQSGYSIYEILAYYK